MIYSRTINYQAMENVAIATETFFTLRWSFGRLENAFVKWINDQPIVYEVNIILFNINVAKQKVSD